MKKSHTMVSVILPARNAMPFLSIAVDSILRQRLESLELIIINDGSTDGTTDYLKSLADHRVHVEFTQGIGIVGALNLGLAMAQGRYIARQDADDYSHPQRLACQLRYLQAHPDVDVLATRAAFINEEGILVENDWTRAVQQLHDPAITSSQIRMLLPQTCCLIHGSIMATASSMRSLGGYRSKYEWAEDYDLWLRLLPDHKFAKLPEKLYTYRIHGNQISEQQKQLQTERVICAKLEFLHKIAPHLAGTVRALVLGNNYGTQLYRQNAEAFDLVALPCSETASPDGHHTDTGSCCIGRRTDWDVVIVTDFRRLEECKNLLQNSLKNRYRQEGNFFIRM